MTNVINLPVKDRAYWKSYYLKQTYMNNVVKCMQMSEKGAADPEQFRTKRNMDKLLGLTDALKDQDGSEEFKKSLRDIVQTLIKLYEEYEK